MCISNPKVRSDKYKFTFSKIGGVGGDRGVVTNCVCENNNIISICRNPPNIPNSPKKILEDNNKNKGIKPK